MAGLATEQQGREEVKAGAQKQIATSDQKSETQSKAEIVRDLKRVERFEKLISLTPEKTTLSDDPVGTKPYFAYFNLSTGDCNITRTTNGYTVFVSQLIDNKKHINFSTYTFDKDGKFLERVKTLSTGERSAPDKSVNSGREVDRILPRLGVHNETFRAIDKRHRIEKTNFPRE
jgi:hypothetical protein